MQCLKINSDYTPIGVISWQDAICLWYIGKVEVLEEHDEKISSPSITVPCPSVIRLKKYSKRNKESIVWSSNNVFARDNYQCSYCGTAHAPRSLTIDHIIPKSRGGKKTWENTATACRSCNQAKADKTPQEAGMKLLITPTKPRYTGANVKRNIKNAPEVWYNYLG